MAAIPGSVRVGGFIAPTDSTDTYAVTDETYNKGGYRTVADIAERNAIPTDRRKIGMVVRVLDAIETDPAFFILVGALNNEAWQEWEFGTVKSVNGYSGTDDPSIVILEMVSKSLDDVTYYVDADHVGGDNNDGLSEMQAFETIQKAIDSLPDIINHKVIINLSAATAAYAGFYIQNKIIGAKVSQTELDTIVIQGAYIDATKTGSMSGTMDTSTWKVITDADAGWTAHQLRGLVVFVDSTYFIIRDNTATTIEIAGTHSGAMSGTYAIKDFGSVINTSAHYTSYNSCVEIRNCKGAQSDYSCVSLSKVKITPPNATTTNYGIAAIGSDVHIDHVAVDMVSVTESQTHAGIYTLNCPDVRIENVYSANCTPQSSAGVVLRNTGNIGSLTNIFVYGCNWGTYVDSVSGSIRAFNGMHADNCVSVGVFVAHAHDITGIESPYGSLYINGNVTTNTGTVGIVFHSVTGSVRIGGTSVIESNKYGIQIGTLNPVSVYQIPMGAATYDFLGSIEVKNNTSAALVVVGNQHVKLSYLTGANATSGAYGMYILEGAKVFITGNTTVSGDTGNDVYKDGVVHTYADDFSSAGDAVINTELGTVVKRIE